MCVYYLFSRKDGLTASELSKLTLEDKAAISRALKTLQEKDYVIYDPDGYNAIIRLTDAGREFASVVCEKAEKAVNAGSCDFTDEQRGTFYKELQAIADKLEIYYNNLKRI